MNFMTRRIRMFCVSNIMVSFVCTSFLGMGNYTTLENMNETSNEVSLTSSEVEPASQLGDEKDEKISLEEEKEEVKKEVQEEKKVETKKTTTKSSSSKSTKTTKTTKTSTVTKKEVASTKTYTPAKYDTVTGDAIVNYAKKYLGLRYVSGGNSLSKGTDCSGFTKLIYKEFGITLSRAVRSQVNNGTYVSKKDLKKGDLVFYSNGKGGVSHVGIYMGNGQVIHESKPGVGVKISSVNMMHYVTARRVINSKAIQIANDKKNEETKVETKTDSSLSTSAQSTTTEEIKKEEVAVVKDTKVVETEMTTKESSSVEDVKTTDSVATEKKEEVKTTDSTVTEIKEEKKTEETKEVKQEETKVTEKKEEPKEETKVVETKQEVSESKEE